MDSEILHKEGRGLCFSDVPMERLLMSMKSHLVDRENQENEDPSGLDSELPTKSNGVSGSSRSMHSNGIGLGINRYDNAPTLKPDSSFRLHLDPETLSNVMNSEDQTIEFEIPSANHPRLNTPFYIELRKKYPKAFRRKASLSSLFSEPDGKAATRAGLHPKPSTDSTITGTSKRSPKPCVSLQRSDSILSLKERWQQNQEQWKRLKEQSPFLKNAKHLRSQSVPNVVDLVPDPNALALVPKHNDILFKRRPSEDRPVKQRFASPDSAVEVDSVHSSPDSHRLPSSHERPPRSRTPKLKSARGKPPIGRPSITDCSDADSGIAASHWSNVLTVDTSTPKNYYSSNRLSSFSPLSQKSGQEVLPSSKEKVTSAHANSSIITSEQLIPDDDNDEEPRDEDEEVEVEEDDQEELEDQEDEAETEIFTGHLDKLHPIQAPTKHQTSNAKKPPLPKKPGGSKSQNACSNNSDLSSLDGSQWDIAGGVVPPQKEKRSFLPWKRKKNKGKYTPCSIDNTADSRLDYSSSDSSSQVFATVHPRPRLRSNSLVMQSHEADGTHPKNDASAKPEACHKKPPKGRPCAAVGNDSQEIVSEQDSSHGLKDTRSLSASRSSLTGLRESARRQLGRLRRAVSLEKLNKEEQGVEEKKEKKKNRKLSHQLTKSPSLQSLTSVFKRNTKSSDQDSACSSAQSSFRASKRSLTQEDLSTLSSEGVKHFRSIGKLKQVYSDGSQLIEMTRPPNQGPMGFYVAKGLKHGIFVSRLSDALPEHFFAGLLSIGDEILEINGRKVGDLPLEGVYDLLGHGSKVIMKTLPYAIRILSNEKGE